MKGTNVDELRIGGRCQRHPLNILPCLKCAAEHPQSLTLRDVLRRLHAVIGDGTQKTAAEKLGVSQQYLSDVLNEAREPGPLILAALGIERVVTYRATAVCRYPDCRCPFDHPGTPGWCAKGLSTRGVATDGGGNGR